MEQWQLYFDTNKKHWDSRVRPHIESDFYDVTNFLQGKNTLNQIEIKDLGAVEGKKILHLQCHFGQDTLSLARMGASCVGIDFSSVAIQKANEFAAQLQLNAQFVESSVYDLMSNPSVHLSEKFDIVFTSYGTIVWLPDLDKWAATIAHFLKDDGIFYIADFHPTLYLFNFDTKKIEYNYFNESVYKEEITSTYANNAEISAATEYFWQHPLSDLMGALLRNNLQIIDFQEFNYSPYNCFPNFKETSKGKFQFEDYGGTLPHVFSIKAKK